MPFYTKGPDVLSSVQNEGFLGQQTSFLDSAGSILVRTVHNMPFLRILGYINHSLKSSEDLKSILSEEKVKTTIRSIVIKNGEGGFFYDIIYFSLDVVPYFFDPLLLFIVASFFIFNDKKMSRDEIFVRALLSFVAASLAFLIVLIILPPAWSGYR
ncbi:MULTISPECIES: hypothetical protein [unclassified Saccharibacter]|uniref:hypothetical protein n=1 Tax=unclassified Saccharibacter TaxID=2648722 RepID=UPI001322FA27|nr:MULTISPECIES: hypothetical protein [unclassified Saccharibacter]MXV35800.1 hypothetical protein [Saccharibacter sp. EH611]MXV57921.1 hypothetical protein [Saccharibacter sp. EH70]MXV66316.1 hypothetical protein [Saccharibacter sp. EH60]